MHRFLSNLIFAAAILTASSGYSASPLTQKLAADTIFYGELKLGKTLELVENEIALMGGEEGQALLTEVEQTYNDLLVICEELSFRPAILDNPSGLNLYAMIATLNTPVSKIEIVKEPKQDDQGNYIPGEFEEKEEVKEHTAAAALIIETESDELAANFMAELKTALTAQAAKATKEQDNKDEKVAEPIVFAEEKIENGSLVRFPDDPEAPIIGQLNHYVVVCDVAPEQVWAKLSDTAEGPHLADTELYSRYNADSQASLGAMIINLRSLLEFGEQEMEKDLAEAQEEVAADAPPTPE